MVYAPITERTTRNDYTASASQTTFAYTFWLEAEDYLDVYVNNTLQTLTTDYTISATQVDGGGNVVFNSGLTSGDEVAIVLNPDIERASNLSQASPNFTTGLDKELASLTSYDMYLKDQIKRAVTLAPYINVSELEITAAPVDGQALVWDGTSGNITSSGTVTTKTITSLPSAVSLSDTDEFPLSQTGTEVKTTVADLATYITSAGSFQANDAGLTSISGLTTAADKMIYTTASDTYAVTDLTAFARTILDDADASAVRTTLGLVIGTDVQAHSAVLDATTASYTTAEETKLSGIATGATANSSDATLLDRANHTGTQLMSTISDAGTAATGDIGTDVQAYDLKLQALSNVTGAGADKMVYFTSGTAMSSTSITSFARTLLDDADAATARTTLGAEAADATILKSADIGSTVQGYDADTVKSDVVTSFTAQQNFGEATLTDGATINWNLNTQQAAKVTLGGNRTMAAPTNLVAGGTYVLRVIQDGTGSRTITWNSVFKWAGGTAPTLSTGANAVDILTFISDGTNMYGTFVGDFS